PEWEGSASELLKALNARLPTNSSSTPIYPQDWPKKPATLTTTLQRLAPDLRRVHGLNFEVGRKPGGKRTRFTRITRIVSPENEGSWSSPSSPNPADATDSKGESPRSTVFTPPVRGSS